MGFFSWKTQNSNRSIANRYSSKETFPVTMTDNRGNCWYEPNYEGYGVFGGMDFYELLANMNGLKGRDKGITLKFSGKPFISPNLYEGVVRHQWKNEEPEDCEFQGFFY